MIRGGICVLDEGNRMMEKSWASLAPLLDMRRYVDSTVAGIKIRAHPDFRVCVTMNIDASTYEIPEYIDSRLQPRITLEFPEARDLLRILRLHVREAPEDVHDYVSRFLARAADSEQNFTVRDGINICRYYLKRLHVGSTTALGASDPEHADADLANPQNRAILGLSVYQILGPIGLFLLDEDTIRMVLREIPRTEYRRIL
jgi:hypothetical protein